MCGIVGYVGHRSCLPILLEGLKRLEYRGYDSAGVAVQQNGGSAGGEGGRQDPRARSTPVHETLRRAPRASPTRAGRRTASRTTSTPTRTPIATGDVALVHNGIIENYAVLKSALEAEGHHFQHRDRHRGARAPDRAST